MPKFVCPSCKAVRMASGHQNVVECLDCDDLAIREGFDDCLKMRETPKDWGSSRKAVDNKNKGTPAAAVAAGAKGKR